MCQFTGWEWDRVEDTLTVSRLVALKKQWQFCPPLPLMVSRYVGYEAPDPNETPKTAEDCFEHLFALPPGLVQLEVIKKDGTVRTLQPGSALEKQIGDKLG